ncbi:unnamed protein product [Brassicogethes aeneus]|uniref:C2H2-type domain-containing protein n=1 Tax=Brassicogethes aeneus TaxID=1431903 RepID=A0A9P0BIB5_BRAAE|nr:unnamed protein product [Brassicogethes aeneus]
METFSVNTMGTTSCYTNTSEVVDLDSIFISVLNKKTVSITVGTAHKIVSSLCNIPLTYDAKLRSVIPHMLVHHTKIWPGWQKASKYQSGQLTYEKYFRSFKSYLTYKLVYLAKNDFKIALSQHYSENLAKVENKGGVKVDSETQTEITDKEFAPFSLVISTSAYNVNTIIFTEGPNENIMLKYHLQPNWPLINMAMLLNWPNINVKFTGYEMVVIRKNVHDISRYLSEPNFPSKPEQVEFIQEVNAIDNNKHRKSYSLNLMKAYMEKYLENFEGYIKGHGEPKHLRTQIEETKAFFQQFILDIQDININNSMGANSYVVFNIGGNTYTRNKKVRNQPTLCLFETMTPKVETSLVGFYGVKVNPKGHVSFRTMNPKKFQPPTIEYTCTYCHVRFLNTKSTIDHLYTRHSAEPAVICTKCKKQFELPDLAQNRYAHSCTT